MAELNPWQDAEWIVAIGEDNLLVKNGMAITGSPFARLIPVTGHRYEEVKRDGISLRDLAVGENTFSGFQLDALIDHAKKTGFFGEQEDLV